MLLTIISWLSFESAIKPCNSRKLVSPDPSLLPFFFRLPITPISFSFSYKFPSTFISSSNFVSGTSSWIKENCCPLSRGLGGEVQIDGVHRNWNFCSFLGEIWCQSLRELQHIMLKMSGSNTVNYRQPMGIWIDALGMHHRHLRTNPRFWSTSTKTITPIWVCS